MTDQGDSKQILFGQKAIRANFVSEKELEECLGIQEKIRKVKDKVPRIGEILVHKGYLTKEQVVQILRDRWQPIEGRFGEIAVQLEIVSAEERDRALGIQRKMAGGTGRRPLPIGQIMVQEGMIRPNEILRILTFQHKSVTRCTKCGSAYNIENFKPGLFTCALCGTKLEQVTDLEGLALLSEKEPTQRTVRPLVDFRFGETFGRFKISRKLGGNPFGDCYLAHQEERSRDVVLRLIEPVRTLDPAFKDALMEGAQRAIALSHPHVRRVYMVGRKQGYYYMAMEYVPGRSLREILLEKGSLPYSVAVAAIKKLTEGLRYGLEQGVRHGDLRPSNVVLNGDHAALLDLGIPIDPKEMFHSFRRDMEIPGFYIAPEVVLNADEIDHRADIFSLGCLFYHALSGRSPLRGRSTVEIIDQMTKNGVIPLRQNASHVPAEACDLVGAMISIDASARPADYDELIRLLEALPGEAKKTGLGQIDYQAALGEEVMRIPDEEVEKAKLQSGRRRRKKADRVEDRMSYAELVKKMKEEGGAEEEEAVEGAARPTLETLAEKKPPAKLAVIHGGKKLRSTPFWGAVGAVAILGGAVVAVVLYRTNEEHAAGRAEVAERREADARAAERTTRDAQVAAQSFEARQRLQLLALWKQLVAELATPSLTRNTVVAIEVLVAQARSIASDSPVSGDLEMALGRAYFYRIASDAFRSAERAEREEWLANARKHLKEADTAYGLAGAQTFVGKDTALPDGKGTMDLSIHLPAGAPERYMYREQKAPWYVAEPAEDPRIDYKGSPSFARQDVQRILEEIRAIEESEGG